MVRLLTNPLILRAMLVLFAAGIAFLAGVWIMRRFRHSLAREANLDATGVPSVNALPIHLYHTVIQQLQQQKHELQEQTLAEQRRARTTEHFSQAVLSNLPSGILVFGHNGLVQQANPAAKQILGFHSLSGMRAEDIFRNAAVCSPDSSSVYPDGLPERSIRLADVVEAVLRENGQRRQIEVAYATPAGETLHIAVTVSPVPGADGSLLGAACLISDRSELQRHRRQQELHGEISAEMALELRTSLTTIAANARQLAKNRDPDLAPQLAEDIASEAARLDRRIGGFLAGRSAAVADTGARAAGGV